MTLLCCPSCGRVKGHRRMTKDRILRALCIAEIPWWAKELAPIYRCPCGTMFKSIRYHESSKHTEWGHLALRGKLTGVKP